jgi:alpha-beta hydrolase superfamily lysophospholipase
MTAWGFVGRLVALVACAGLAACAARPAVQPAAVPSMTLNAVYTADGADLPLRSFLPAGPPRAVIVGVHGFNDYSNAFSEPGLFFMAHGFALYAYDQRGFGDAPDIGLWAGRHVLADDLRLVIALVRRRHPGAPLFVLGESMGGAVAMVALTAPDPPAIDGLVLIAPAVRGRDTLTALQRAVLDVVSSALPWFPVTSQGVQVIPSDNITMLRQLARDPRIIKHTRSDAVRGLVDLMGAASAAAGGLTVPTLILAGERDEIVTPVPTCLMLSRLPRRPPGTWRFVLYPHGYHMLLRDHAAALVMTDIEHWMEDRATPLPSGDERLAAPTEPTAADIARLPTCHTVVDRLRDHAEFTALRPTE